PKTGSIGAKIPAAVSAAVVIDPTDATRTAAITYGMRINGIFVEAMFVAISSTAGFSLTILAIAPPIAVTSNGIIATAMARTTQEFMTICVSELLGVISSSSFIAEVNTSCL